MEQEFEPYANRRQYILAIVFIFKIVKFPCCRNFQEIFDLKHKTCVGNYILKRWEGNAHLNAVCSKKHCCSTSPESCQSWPYISIRAFYTKNFCIAVHFTKIRYDSTKTNILQKSNITKIIVCSQRKVCHPVVAIAVEQAQITAGSDRKSVGNIL